MNAIMQVFISSHNMSIDYGYEENTFTVFYNHKPRRHCFGSIQVDEYLEILHLRDSKPSDPAERYQLILVWII